MVDISRKIIEIYDISAKNIKAYIAFKTDNIYVLQIKNFKIRLYRMNPRPEKMLIILEAYSYIKELFKEKQVEYVLPKHQDQDHEIKLKSRS